MKVDYIIAGGQKCGTTALHYFLSKHPKVIVSNPKEIDFFKYDFNYKKGFQYYHSFFKEKPFLYQIRNFKFLESSPSYINGELFSDSLLTANRIFNYNNNIKIICLVRDPIDRAYSAWNMFKVRYRLENDNWWLNWFQERIGELPEIRKRKAKSYSDFDYFIKEELEALSNGEIIETPVLENGKYINQIKIFNSFFKDNLLIVQNELLNSNTEKEVINISNFLQLSEIDWGFVNGKKIYSGNYEKDISLTTTNVLKDYYKSSNKELFELTKINYLK